jgi:hypothetical protein
VYEVANCVTLQVCLWHDFCNIFLKIELYSLMVIPLPSEKSSVRACVIRLQQVARNVADCNHIKGRGDFIVWANTNQEAEMSNIPTYS